MPVQPRVSGRDTGMLVVALLGLLAFLDSLFNYFWTSNGIHGSEGALLVVVSTLLLTLASSVIAAGRVGGWLRALLAVLIVLDLIGTTVAGYFLEAWILEGLIILAAIAWIVHLLRPVRPVVVRS